MSSQTSSHSFNSFPAGVPTIPCMERDTAAVRLFRQILPAVIDSITPPPQPPCLVEELIDLSIYWLRVLALLVDTVATGDAVPAYAQEQIDRLMEEDELRDIHTFDALDEKHGVLKHIATSLANSVEDCCTVWDGLNSRRSNSYSLNLNVQGDLAAPLIPTAPLSPQVHVPLALYAGLVTEEPEGIESGDDQDDDQHEDKATPILSQLGSRGRGRYTCPYGRECNKGGIGPHNELRVFELNSTFRDHLHRHLRPLKCTVLGCTNTKGFTKQGNLDRHMRKVHHREP